MAARSRAPFPPGLILSLLLLITITGVALAVLIGAFRFASGPPLDRDAAPRLVTPRGDLAADEQATIELFRRASPSVVHIRTVLWRRGLVLNAVEIPKGVGSGFVWDAQGYVVTNYHVLEGAEGAEVILSDHSSWPARLVAWDPDFDLAVIKIEAPDERLRPIPLGSSADLQVGQKVFAIGNPFGLDQTLTTGVISGLEREIISRGRRPIRGVIQTDAAINPGNSGGPLLDSSGRLIGVNTAIVSGAGAGYSGVGFAVPVDTVNRVVPQLLRSGRVSRAQLGIYAETRQKADQLGVEGVVVSDVAPGSGAERAGIVPAAVEDGRLVAVHDVIVAVDGQRVRDVEDIRAALEERSPGERVRVEVLREGRVVDLDVELRPLE